MENVRIQVELIQFFMQGPAYKKEGKKKKKKKWKYKNKRSKADFTAGNIYVYVNKNI